ncbi:hypothetical protein TNCV_4584971 [Trichonephila clavipes]|nr:hypothetical protein TNCV_4584971 [Trichonephila clavipes]
MFQILLWSPWKYRCGQRTVRMAVMACSQNQAVFARRRSELKLKLELVEEKQKLLDIRAEKERSSEGERESRRFSATRHWLQPTEATPPHPPTKNATQGPLSPRYGVEESD